MLLRLTNGRLQRRRFGFGRLIDLGKFRLLFRRKIERFVVGRDRFGSDETRKIEGRYTRGMKNKNRKEQANFHRNNELEFNAKVEREEINNDHGIT